MGYTIFVRREEKIVEVARVTDGGEWSGDESVIGKIQDLLKERNAGIDRLPEIVSGGYVWAARTDQRETET